MCCVVGVVRGHSAGAGLRRGVAGAPADPARAARRAPRAPPAARPARAPRAPRPQPQGRCRSTFILQLVLQLE